MGWWIIFYRKMYNNIASFIKNYIGESERSKKAFNNIVLSLFFKVVSIFSTMLIVPLTIEYVNATQYGIWMALSSIVGWIAFLDLGLGNGFRNKFAESVAKDDIFLAQQYVSTSYFALIMVSVLILIVGLFINALVDWTTVLGIENNYRQTLHITFGIVIFFFCVNLVANLICMLLSANQQPGLASLLTALGQLFSLVTIYFLTVFTKGSLVNLALFFSGIPCVILVIGTLILFNCTNYKKFVPKINCIRFKLVKDILSLGAQFFIIYICLILIFQVVNIVISRELGPESVTEYNIANKYFNILYMVTLIVITPFWSAFTDAYAKKDFLWMKTVLTKLERIWLFGCFLGFIMLLISDIFFKIWIGDKANIHLSLSVSMLIYVLCQNIGSLYMYLINGIGTIRIQLIAYVILAFISWPIFIFSCKMFGLPGIVLMPAAAYGIQAILGKIQINKILNNKASGIWGR